MKHRKVISINPPKKIFHVQPFLFRVFSIRAPTHAPGGNLPCGEPPSTPSGVDASAVETEFPDLTTERGEERGFILLRTVVETKGSCIFCIGIGFSKDRRSEVVEVEMGRREHAHEA